MSDGDQDGKKPATAGRIPTASQKELEIIRECLFEALWYRSMPMASLSGAAVFYLIKKGYLKPGKTFGPWGKMAAAAAMAYWVGKVSYLLGDNCKNKFLSEAPYDEIAYHIRKSRGLPQPWQSEDKFGRKHPKDDRVEEPRPEPEAFDMDKDVRAETSFLGYVSQMKLDEREQKTLRDCNRCAFYYNSLPSCIFMSVTVNSLINHGYLPPSKNFHGPWSSKAPKLLLGVTIGYTIGQVMYWRTPDCSDRFLKEIPRGRVADFIREKRRRLQTSKIESQKVISATSTVDENHSVDTYLTLTDPREILHETRVTSLRDILERGVRDGRLKPENLKILDDLEVR